MQHFLVIVVIALSAVGALLFSGNITGEIRASNYAEADREAVERERVMHYISNSYLEKNERSVERDDMAGKEKVMYYDARDKGERNGATDWLSWNIVGILVVAIIIGFTQKTDEMEQI